MNRQFKQLLKNYIEDELNRHSSIRKSMSDDDTDLAYMDGRDMELRLLAYNFDIDIDFEA